MTECAYCGCAVEVHDPVFVSEFEAGERVEASAYCNYACLSAHIEDAGLADGATCRLDAVPTDG